MSRGRHGSRLGSSQLLEPLPDKWHHAALARLVRAEILGEKDEQPVLQQILEHLLTSLDTTNQL